MNITPNDQTVESCLQNKSYDIDFYQREYVWDKGTVITLLNDIFDSFDLGYQENHNIDITKDVIDKYNWYYLNTYITNNIGGKNYIVDGQQRLTTLSLIALRLYHFANENNENKEYCKNVIDNLKECIYGNDKYNGYICLIDDEKRHKVMKHILDNPKPNYSDPIESLTVTEQNILERYKNIDEFLESKKLSDDKYKLLALIMYFLDKLILIELKIEKDDTPMVFEAINDRGEALKPFEILKGKLIGALKKDDTEKYSNLWEESLNKLQGLEDSFFIDYLKGRFVFKRNSDLEKDINNEYHRYIFKYNNKIADTLGFRKNDKNRIKNIKSFIENDLVYYSKLYSKIKKNEYLFLEYNNKINDLSGQYQNIIAACKINDSMEQSKIETISREIDRFYMLLHLNGIYDSNEFTELQYKLNEQLPNELCVNYRNIFDTLLKDKIKDKRHIVDVNSLLEYDKFLSRDFTNMRDRVLRYFFARIESYIRERMGDSMTADEVYSISTTASYKKGYHIEHILSRNEENRAYFETEEEFDENRNKLGGLLLLRGKENVSSGNEPFSDKLKTYNNCGLEWGKTLVGTVYYRTNKKFLEFNSQFKEKTGCEFKSFEKFNKEALEDRSKLLFNIVKEIWEVE